MQQHTSFKPLLLLLLLLMYTLAHSLLSTANYIHTAYFLVIFPTYYFSSYLVTDLFHVLGTKMLFLVLGPKLLIHL